MTLIADKEVRVEEAPTTEAPAKAPVAETRPHRRPLVRPGHLGMVALGLALVGAVLSFFVFYGMTEWFLPIFLIGPAIALGAYALSQRGQRKGAAVAAIVIATLALMPPTASLALAGYSSALDGGTGLTGDSETTAYDALQTIITGDDGTNGGNGGTGTDGANGQTGGTGATGGTGTNGTNGTNGSNGTDGTDGTTTTTDPQTGGPLIDVNLDLGLGGTGTGTPATPVAPVIAVDLTGAVGDLLTTSANVKVKVGSVTCGLPLVSALGISLSLFNQMCAVNVTVTNNSATGVAINSGSLTGITGGSSILGDLGIGTSPLSTTVAAGATATGNLYVKLPNATSVLDRLELRLGGELLKVQVH